MIGERLRELRVGSGMNQPEFAAIAGTSKQYVGRLEKGFNKDPNPKYIAAWAKHFGVRIEWIISGKPPKEELAGSSQATSQPMQLTRETILDAVRLAAGASGGLGLASFEIETAEDAELLLLAIEEVQEEDIHGTTDSDVLRFARKIHSRKEDKDGQVRTTGSDGRANRSAGQEEVGDAARPAASRRRRSA